MALGGNLSRAQLLDAHGCQSASVVRRGSYGRSVHGVEEQPSREYALLGVGDRVYYQIAGGR
jgi:hypothetical protein